MAVTNYAVTIPHHANWIWEALCTDATVSTDTYAWVAADLEEAETFLDEGCFQKASQCILDAARQVFGIYSEQFAHLVSFYSA